VDLKYRLGNVETDCRDRLHDLAPPNRGGFSTHIHGTHVCATPSMQVVPVNLAFLKYPASPKSSWEAIGKHYGRRQNAPAATRGAARGILEAVVQPQQLAGPHFLELI
jgi:hypothetical protein